MSDSPFVHLAVRSSYSLLESMITPKALVLWATEHEMPAIAVTDHNNLFGALEISETLSGDGVQPIVACCFDILEDERKGETSRVSLYAQNEAGYRRLMKLSSLAYLEAHDGVPKLARGHLLSETDGLILFTGGVEGRVGQHLAKGRMEEAREELEQLSAAYPGRCYVEIMRHGAPEEAVVEPGLLDLAYEMNLPIVATHDARFMKPTDAGAHDAMMCIANGRYLGEEDRPRVQPSQYLKSADEMRILFADLPDKHVGEHPEGKEILRACAPAVGKTCALSTYS